MKQVTFFIPHYADHKRLKTQLRLTEKICSFPRKYIIYDSSPNPIGHTSITHLLGTNEFTYREKEYVVEGNTYAYVLRDFLLSEDSDNGAFILPHDELLYIDGEDFMNISASTPFACGTQLSYCPDSKKLLSTLMHHIHHII